MPEQRSSLFISNPIRLASGGGGGNSAAYTNFIALTSGLDATHLSAYAGLLNGLTSDGLFNSDGSTNFYDALYILATQDSTTAKLNLVSTSFNLTTVNNPADLTFTTDRGYQNGGGNTGELTTSFNPTTAISPKFVQNSAHISIWQILNAVDSNPLVGIGSMTPGETTLYPNFSDGNLYTRVNDSAARAGFAVSPVGHLIGNRSGASSGESYRNGSSVGTTTNASGAPANGNIISFNVTGGNVAHQLAAWSFGSSLSGTNATKFYNRLRTYMTTVGVP